LGDLRSVAEYADAIGIYKPLATPKGVVDAHALNLAVHVWTFRAENEFLPADLKVGDDPAAHGNLDAEIERYLLRGIDGFFYGFPRYRCFDPECPRQSEPRHPTLTGRGTRY
jgi:glycerophosphoryl diester phosphodiesterase